MRQETKLPVVPRGENMDDKKKRTKDVVPDIILNSENSTNFFRPHYPVESSEFTETVVPDTDI